MQFNEDLLKRLVQTDDETLKKTVESAARAAGAGQKQAGRLTADMDSLRRVIAGLKTSDLEGIVRAVGEDNLKTILSAVTSEGKKDG